MAQFDVYKNENMKTKESVPYLLDVQNDMLKSLNTRMIIPLTIYRNNINGITKEFIIENKKVYLTTYQMAAVHLSKLDTKVLSLKAQKDEIKNSLDFLIYGF